MLVVEAFFVITNTNLRVDLRLKLYHGPECLKHSDQQQWDARFHVSAGQDAAKENPWMLQPQTQDVCRERYRSHHRWEAEINCIKTIQIILVSYQFVTKCI